MACRVRPADDEDLLASHRRRLCCCGTVEHTTADESVGIDPRSMAQPLQAAWISAVSFASFGFVPIVTLVLAPAALRIPAMALVSLASLAALGAFGGYLGGAPMGRAALRVTLGGGLAMAVTAAIGRLFAVVTG